MTEDELDSALRELQIKTEINLLSEKIYLYYKYYYMNKDKVNIEFLYMTLHDYFDVDDDEKEKIIKSAINQVKTKYKINI